MSHRPRLFRLQRSREGWHRLGIQAGNPIASDGGHSWRPPRPPGQLSLPSPVRPWRRLGTHSFPVWSQPRGQRRFSRGEAGGLGGGQDGGTGLAGRTLGGEGRPGREPQLLLTPRTPQDLPEGGTFSNGHSSSQGHRDKLSMATCQVVPGSGETSARGGSPGLVLEPGCWSSQCVSPHTRPHLPLAGARVTLQPRPSGLSLAGGARRWPPLPAHISPGPRSTLGPPAECWALLKGESELSRHWGAGSPWRSRATGWRRGDESLGDGGSTSLPPDLTAVPPGFGDECGGRVPAQTSRLHGTSVDVA